VIWIGGEDLAVELFRLREPAGLVMGEGLLERGGEWILNHCRRAHQVCHMRR
jgi:hypothetical protein